MKRADKITKTAGHPVCPYCKHPNDVFHFNLHKEGEPINSSCDNGGCGAEYQWTRYVVELYVSETMPEPPEVAVFENIVPVDDMYNMVDEGEIR